MTQLTGSHGPVTTSLQHNAEAMRELNDARTRHENLLHDAEQASRGVMAAEMHLDELKARLRSVGRRLPAAQAADAAIGSSRAGSIASVADQLEQDIPRAEQVLRDAQQRADAVNAARLEALNAFHSLQTMIYEPSSDLVEEG